MKIRRFFLAGVICLLTVLVTACATTSQGQPSVQKDTLAGTEWALVSLNGDAPIGDRAITLRFGETSIEGSGGCNTYGGSYTTSEDSLHLTDVYWTEMACMEPEGIMEQEQTYFQALNATARYQTDADRLELYDEAGAQILMFILP
jgi:heat shock protein HslJ